jgi:rhodanese-related sulfurtransferase
MLRALKAMFGLPQGNSVDVQQAARLLADGAVMIDVREPDEWQAGHVAAAIHVPLGRIQSQGAAAIAHALQGKDGQPVLMFCRSGGRSGMACDLLQQALGDRATNVRGGVMAWAAAGLPLAR